MLYTEGKTKQVYHRSELESLPIVSKENYGSRWEGLEHGRFASLMVDAIHANDMDIEDESWMTNPDGSDLFCSIRVKSSQLDNLLCDTHGRFCIGGRHSNKQKTSIQIVAGYEVAVCSNGVFSGEFFLKQRHVRGTGEILLPLMQNAVLNARNHLVNDLPYTIRGMRRTRLTEAAANKLLVEAGRRGVISWSSLGKVDAAWRNPPHEEFRDRNCWSMYNAFTEVAKANSATRQFEILKDAKDLVLDFVPAYQLN